MNKLIVCFSLAAIVFPVHAEPARKRYLVGTERPFREDTLRKGSFVRFAGVDGYALELSDEEAEALAATSGVRYVEPDTERFVFGMSSPHLDVAQSTPWGLTSVNAPAVWFLTRGEGVRVGIIDTGIDLGHPDLQAAYRGGYDFVHNDPVPEEEAEGAAFAHGTRMAGVLAASDNGVGRATTRRRSWTRVAVAAAVAATIGGVMLTRPQPRPPAPLVAETPAARELTTPTDATTSIEWNGATLRLDRETHLRFDTARTATLLREHALRAADGPRGSLLIVRDERPPRESASGPAPLMPVTLEEIVVTPSRFTILREEAESRQFLSREEVRRVPHLSDDLYRAIGRIPGTTSADVSARFNLRGGEEDEVLVLVDGAEIYDPFHIRDLYRAFSTIDAEAVGSVDVLSGGYPSEYGGRMSGVVDITTLSPSETRHELGVSLLNTRLLSQGTFAQSRGAWLLSPELFNVLGHENVTRVNSFEFQQDASGAVTASPVTESVIGILPSFGVTWRF